MTTSTQKPKITDILLEAVDGKPGLAPALTRATLRGLALLHGVVLEIDLACYALGLAKVTKLPAEVISVGNLSMGGTGKTLAVLKLTRELTAAGRKVAILSRGYRRKSHDEIAVVSTPAGIRLTVPEAGDEPYLLASLLPGIPVVVGKNRRVTGRYAIDTFGVDTLILDDGFQYWRLHKDHEIVLLDALQPATRDHLLPRGLFREPWSHLRRAQEVWITHAQLAAPERVAQLARRVARYAPRAHMRATEHGPVRLRAATGETRELATLRGVGVLALSGLGNPQQFETMLANLGAEVAPCRYPDHHPYTAADLADIAAQAGDLLVVTTAKDAARLPADTPFTYWIADVELVDVPFMLPPG